MKNNRGCTYLITNGIHYKIDVTTDTLVKRVGELQTGSPTKISISAYCYNSSPLAMKLELYQKFSHKRLEDGWFALDDDDVAIIYHHFENNYLDEYCTPWSEKRIEEVNQEIEEKKQEDENLKALRIRYAETSLAARNYNIEYNPNNDSKELIERLIEDVKDEDESWLQKHIKNNINELERQKEKLKEREELAELEEQELKELAERAKQELAEREEQELKELEELEEEELKELAECAKQELAEREEQELKELEEQNREEEELKELAEREEQELKELKELKERKKRKEREEQELKEFIELKERAEQERIAKEQEELKEREVYLAKERKKWAEEESEAYFAKERKKLEEQELKAKAKALVINRAKIFVFMGVVVIIGVAIL